MKIIQIAPEIGPGSGVAGVAYALEQEWLARGVEVYRFTMSEADGDWIHRVRRAPLVISVSC